MWILKKDLRIFFTTVLFISKNLEKNKIKNRVEPFEQVLSGTHGGFVRAYIQSISELPPNYWRDFSAFVTFAKDSDVVRSSKSVEQKIYAACNTTNELILDLMKIQADEIVCFYFNELFEHNHFNLNNQHFIFKDQKSNEEQEKFYKEIRNQFFITKQAYEHTYVILKLRPHQYIWKWIIEDIVKA